MIAESIFIGGEKIYFCINIDEQSPPPIEEIVNFARKMNTTYHLGKTEMFVVKFKHFGNLPIRMNYHALEDKIKTVRHPSQ